MAEDPYHRSLRVRFRKKNTLTASERHYPYICPHCRLRGRLVSFPVRPAFLAHLAATHPMASPSRD